jgi:hypothetical protein
LFIYLFLLELLVTGHSLGASLVYPSTVHLIWDVGYLGHKINAYSFGAGRVFNPKGARWWNNVLMKKHLASSFRFVQGRDVVTKIPLKRTILTSYMHAAREVWLKNDGAMRVSRNDLEEEDPRGAASHRGINFTDHNYYFGEMQFFFLIF